MTIEIKPKAGYLPISPLIHPFHRIKYTTCRFQLLQTLHLHGKWSKGWTAQTTTVKERKRKQSDFICSEYNPLHFFDHSGSSSIHQRSSIMKLLQCPQNNLRIWYDNIMIVGFNKDDDDDDENNDIPQKHGHDDDDPSAYRQVLNALLSEREENAVDNIMSSGNENSYHVPNDSTLNLILESIILEVMVSDPAKQLLRRLLDWQKLDVVDVDGAGLVYQRLVDYCHGSHAKAQTLVDTIQPNDLMENPIHDNSLQPQQEQDTTGTTRKSKVLPLFELSPFRCDNLLDESFDILLAFCQEVYDLQEELEVSRPALPNETFMNTKRDIVLDIVKTLPIDACVFILRNWLLSLAMCDVSIYITLQPLIDDEHLTSQTDGQFITVTFHNGVTRNFVFCLHIIDCDQKPAKKLEGRLEKEAAFRFFV
jgi:inositol-pentakisphosphate 2-kinase